MSKIKREKHKGRQQCDHCKKPAVVKFTLKENRKAYRAYGCSDHEGRAKSSLEGSW
jgi:hypothetical protein